MLIVNAFYLDLYNHFCFTVVKRKKLSKPSLQFSYGFINSDIHYVSFFFLFRPRQMVVLGKRIIAVEAKAT